MTDIEIAKSVEKENITEIAKKLGIEDLDLYGKYKAKINCYNKVTNGKLVLVTAMNPTKYGEGKTTVSIGLADALNHIGKSSVLALREPSLGPVFGMKGGATGGGRSQVVPMEDINLHFTGDFHAITSANNLLCAAIDNMLYFGNSLNLNPETIIPKRCLDVNDRALRKISIGNSMAKEVSRSESFTITAASEMMSIFVMSRDIEDLKRRVDNIVIGYSYDGKKILARELNISGAISVLLKDAMKVNLVQTLEKTPVLMHGGPFANISLGVNTVRATNMALNLADYVITEAGFGADLGAEKFINVICQQEKLNLACVVLTVTMKAIKFHGGDEDTLDAIRCGFSNVKCHIDNLKKCNLNIVVALNKYESDTDEEIKLVKELVEEEGEIFAITDAYSKGGVGAIPLAEAVVKACNHEKQMQFIYDFNDTLEEKIEKVCHEFYHAKEIKYLDGVYEKLKKFEQDYNNYPICMAKTQYSVSDNNDLLGYPKDYTVTIRDIAVYGGGGFVVIYLGSILTMPALPKEPNYLKIDLDDNEEIVGIF